MNLLPLPLRLRRAGIVYPNWTRQAASKWDVPLEWLCAILMNETSGGHNIFQDGGIFGGLEVTKARVETYLAYRDKTGTLTGVGPMQLTAKSLQDAATAAGGLWLPQHTISVGAHYLAGLHEQTGDWQLAAQEYNGSGPAAVAYGERAAALAEHFQGIIGT